MSLPYRPFSAFFSRSFWRAWQPAAGQRQRRRWLGGQFPAVVLEIRADGINQPALRGFLDVQRLAGKRIGGRLGRQAKLVSFGTSLLPAGTWVCKALSTRKRRILARVRATPWNVRVRSQNRLFTKVLSRSLGQLQARTSAWIAEMSSSA